MLSSLTVDIAEFVAKLRPDFVIKGKEFENAFNPEAAVVESYGGKLIFSSGDVQFASTDLLRQRTSAGLAASIITQTLRIFQSATN